jgi:hypothetical protein
MRIAQLLITSIFLLGGKTPEKGKWIVDSSSKLVIYGDTNLNKFKCETDCFEKIDTLTYHPEESACDIFFSQTQIRVPVKSFTCGNEMITKDFWETLNVDKFPTLTVHFLNLKDFSTAENGDRVRGEVAIVLAGVKKQYHIQYTLQRHSQDYFSLTGKQPVCFSDFQLKAPRKMLGLIQVQEDLEVEFLMKLKVLN